MALLRFLTFRRVPAYLLPERPRPPNR